jgi:uncharacterized protein (TIGR00369 family)
MLLSRKRSPTGNNRKTSLPQEGSGEGRRQARTGRLVYFASMRKQAGFSAVDAKYEQRVRESFQRQGLMKHLGAELVELKAGHAVIRVPFRSELCQQHNYFHAGVSGAIADSACGYAAATLMPAESAVLTVEYKLNLLAPAEGDELMARARVVRSGRTLKVCAADVHARKNGKEVHCATMLATIMCLPGKAERRG